MSRVELNTVGKERIPVLDYKIVSSQIGKSLKRHFYYGGYDFWIGAEYFPDGYNRFLVYYMIGMNGVSFAVRTEAKIKRNIEEIIVIECSPQEIEARIEAYCEVKREEAAKRYLRTLYNLADCQELWRQNGNETYANKLDQYPRMNANSIGSRNCLKLHLKAADCEIDLFCEYDEIDATVDVLGHIGLNSFLKMCDFPYHGEGHQELAEAVQSNLFEKYGDSSYWHEVNSIEVVMEPWYFSYDSVKAIIEKYAKSKADAYACCELQDVNQSQQ